MTRSLIHSLQERFNQWIAYPGIAPETFAVRKLILLGLTNSFIGSLSLIIIAWSWGLPIVSTTIGAEGIETRHEQNILIADTPADFAQATIRVLNDPVLAQQLQQGGRQSVIEKYNWRTIYPAWDDVYAGL